GRAGPAGRLHRPCAWPLRDRQSSKRRTNMQRLEGKVAVVAGGNSSIGLATAKRLQEEGTRVASSGRSKTTLDEAGKMIGTGVLAVQADVTKLAEVAKLYVEVPKKLGKIDVLFVNAGVATFAPLAKTSESLYGSDIPASTCRSMEGVPKSNIPW